MSPGRHRPSAPMHADDPVAPGIKRSRSAVLVGVGLALVVGAIVGITLTLAAGVKDAKDSATLSSDETRQLREFLADRGRQRDQERADVQAQLDSQRGVLCAAINTLRASATRPTPRQVLGKAATDLRCPRLPMESRTSSTADRVAPRPSSTTGTPAPAATTSAARPSASPARANPAPPRAASSTSAPRASTPAPAPKPTPKPTPAPTTPPPALLDPVTAPVCNLLGLCL